MVVSGQLRSAQAGGQAKVGHRGTGGVLGLVCWSGVTRDVKRGENGERRTWEGI